MTLDRLSYLAGILDGEGTVSFQPYHKDRRPIFTMEIRMTSENVIDWLKDNFGGCKVYLPSKKANWKDQYRWRLRGQPALELFAKLQPMLMVKII